MSRSCEPAAGAGRPDQRVPYGVVILRTASSTSS